MLLLIALIDSLVIVRATDREIKRAGGGVDGCVVDGFSLRKENELRVG